MDKTGIKVRLIGFGILVLVLAIVLVSNGNSVTPIHESQVNVEQDKKFEYPKPGKSGGEFLSGGNVTMYSMTDFHSDGVKIVGILLSDGSKASIAVSDNPITAISKGKFFPSLCKKSCILLLPEDRDVVIVKGCYSGPVDYNLLKTYDFVHGAEFLSVKP